MKKYILMLVSAAFLVGLAGCGKPDLTSQEKTLEQQREALDKWKQEMDQKNKK